MKSLQLDYTRVLGTRKDSHSRQVAEIAPILGDNRRN
jgi:hypothetical protein